MDQYIYDEVFDFPNNDKQIIDKEMLYVNDQNNGSYNGQITFDSSTLSNSGRWCNYQEGYLVIPYVISAVTSVDTTATFNQYIAGLKSGFHQIVHSFQVDYNNTNAVQLQSFLNHFVSYKLMTSFSTNDLQKYGDLIGFFPDTSDSFTYSTAAAVDGIGFCNNKVVYAGYFGATTNYNVAPPTGNDGWVQRLRNLTYNPSSSAIASATLSLTKARTAGKSFFSNNGGAGAARVYYWAFLATIRLKDLSNFFETINPLLRGAFFRIVLNYNASSFVITSTGAAGAAHTLTTSLPVQLAGSTNPVLVSSSQADTSPIINNPFDVAAGTITFNSGVVSTPQISGVSALTTCRMYVPAYQLNPLYEKDILTRAPTRKIQYYDIYNFNLQGGNAVAAGTSFNAILTNGIVNPLSVVIIPQITASANGLANLVPYQSPFDTSPATTMPLASITNFNVQVGGTNIFQQNFNYDFEEFSNELSHINAINGGLSTGLTSGLISYRDWTNAYRYYAVDLKRRLPNEDTVPKSILISGTNNTAKSMDLICFITYQREITIDMATGELINGSA
jgi:hypothetical protein